MKNSTLKKKNKQFNLFHSLGKFLHNKRKNQKLVIYYFLGLDSKTNKSRNFTKEEMIKYKPDFYFNPLEIIKDLDIN